MKEDELRKIWKSSPNGELVRLEKSGLINDIQSDMNHWIKMLKSRDLYVILLLFATVLLFGTMAYAVPSILSKIGAMLCLLSFVYWLIRLRSIKKLQPRSFSEAYLDYLYKIREYLKVEKKFWEDTLYWLFPSATIGILLFGVGTFKTFPELILKILFLVGVSILGYFFHKRLVKKVILSRLEKVEKLIEAMEE